MRFKPPAGEINQNREWAWVEGNKRGSGERRKMKSGEKAGRVIKGKKCCYVSLTVATRMMCFIEKHSCVI